LAEALTTASLRDLEEAARRDDAEGFEEECIAYLPNADDLSDLRSLLRVEPPVLPVFAALARLHRKARKRFEELDTDLFWLGVQRNLTDDSLLLDRAQDEALRHIPPMPRNAKRLLNRLRVLMVMAAGRSLFSGSDERTEHMARCLGKWAVLCERWPELAQALIEDPDRMEELERAADKGTMYGFSRIAQRIAPGLASEEDLREFCESAVKLGPERNWLAHFEPVQAAQNGDGAASATGTNSNKPDAA
jgi:ParB-like chromosome segregation protein Spo0J